MTKPVIWTVDDDPDVLRAVERDLRRQYGDRYRVMSADSGASALEAVKRLKLRNDPVALFLADQRMPRMSGVEFLEKAIEFYPDAKRALLTAYADTDAAIRAINTVQIDHYLMKPWDPPEERLFGVVDDLLDDWQAAYRPAFEGVRVIGHRWSPQSNEIRDFLGRNFVPHQWLNVETDEVAKQLLTTTGAAISSLPVVIFPDGSFLGNPPFAEVARKLGLKTKPEFPFYDLVVVGAGPAGLAAAVYGAADGLHTLLIEREAPGGQAGRSSRIENYLGFPTGLSGSDLARRAVAQARRFGVEILAPQEVKSVRIEGPARVLTLADGAEIGCRALLIASGIAFRKLDVPGLERLNGAGVYYYAPMSEAFSYRDGEIYIVGGANSAGQAAMYFSKFARQVTLLVRGHSLSDSMSQYLENQIAATKNIAVRFNSSVVEVAGADRCEQITISDSKARLQETVTASALLIYAGAIPRTDWLAGIVERDAQGYLISGQQLMREGRRPKGWTADRDPFYLETSVPGIFVAGDVRHRSAKGVTSGVGEGAMAVKLVHEYLGLL
ncbi:MAG: Response regulator receiver modulated FAD-dependent pyridine nucleotide-disulfide oxidoreductase [Pedosphaera sp.]|nr:Response regulator receiver modulated FAD-dependent pyridine nucleotide-disulfide oxidoreductase [Pedosphaera sp.]